MEGNLPWTKGEADIMPTEEATVQTKSAIPLWLAIAITVVYPCRLASG